MINSRGKGIRGENEWAAELTRLGFPAYRVGQTKGGPDCPDIAGGIRGTHAEVKRCEALSLYRAMDQAVRDADGKKIPYVAHRRNNKDWLMVFRAQDLLNLAAIIWGTQQ